MDYTNQWMLFYFTYGWPDLTTACCWVCYLSIVSDVSHVLCKLVNVEKHFNLNFNDLCRSGCVSYLTRIIMLQNATGHTTNRLWYISLGVYVAYCVWQIDLSFVEMWCTRMTCDSQAGRYLWRSKHPFFNFFTTYTTWTWHFGLRPSQPIFRSIIVAKF